MAARSPTAAISSRRSTSSVARIRLKIQDWRILSAQGAALDQLGRSEEAQQYYATALKIVPEEPSVLSNLGLSYMLQNNLPRAEETLRRANSRNPADSRVRANLALVVGLEGKQAEAETIVKADLPPDQAAEKVTGLRQLLAKKQQRADK
ncbi:Flp pilus assembly protein TadD [Bradyrhizobium sp. LB7.1]